MEVKSYRARTLQDALRLVYQDLGPEATVLQTKQVWDGILRGLFGKRQIEVTASNQVHVPSRFAPTAQRDAMLNAGLELTSSPASTRATHSAAYSSDDDSPSCGTATLEKTSRADAHEVDSLRRLATGRSWYDADDRGDDARDESTEKSDRRTDLQQHGSNVKPEADRSEAWGSWISRPKSTVDAARDLPQSLFHLFTDLVDADVDQDLARELVAKLRERAANVASPAHLYEQALDTLAAEISIQSPISAPEGSGQVVALVGPTGVGKTTTIAKLAANFRLREKKRVGLVTVDTYRIAAVEQLRTYADIIDLPMEVVSTVKEMRNAIQRLSHLDLILMDTAGRSPRDEIKIRELQSILTEAEADQVHLVLSATASQQTLIKTAEQFAAAGTTSLLITKLDESTGLGNLLPLWRACPLPMSYVTNGQNVPDDIQPADSRRLAAMLLGKRDA